MRDTRIQAIQRDTKGYIQRDTKKYKRRDTYKRNTYKGIHTKGYIQRDTYKGIQRDTKMRHRSWYLANESPYTVPAEEGE